ncbi:MAG: glycoside hydrolase [Spirochaetes bacterium GWB1_48_6]|nr:MAG: glycoside hydrolase [Spirochaetes bacterium GWB1_48_6]
MKKGQLLIVLNAHLPFVRHPEFPSFLEENWLFEAISETYLPLLRTFHNLENKGIPFRMSLSFSPTLISMLTDSFLQDRYLKHLDLQLELGAKELERTKTQLEFHKLATLYTALYKQNKEDFSELYQGNLLKGFTYFMKKGHLEILSSAATHPLLPLYQDYPENIEAQIQTAVETHYRAFNRTPKGFWLPECAYYPGLDELLKKYKLEYFFTSAHGVLFSRDFPKNGVFAPLRTPQGLHAFARDLSSTNNIWSPEEGYPGDPVYRDFYRDIGFDLPMDYIGPYLQGGENRVNTGFKYYAVSGKTEKKSCYDPEKAKKKIEEHAENFIYNRLKQIEKLGSLMDGKKPLIVAPFDAELFGHFWYEGTAWLEVFWEKMSRTPELEAVTAGDYLLDSPVNQENELSFSTWATGGYAEVWLDGKNDWIIRHTHKCIQRMQELVDRFPNESGRKERALNQAAREVLLCQSSDWPLMIKMGTTVEYAQRRVKEHVNNFSRIYDSLSSNTLETEWLTKLERKNNLFPDLDYRVFKRHQPT